jgi:hypothetical protein
VKALWRRRAVRHVVLGLLPLLVVGPVVTLVLAIRLADTSAPLGDATARATATVLDSGTGADGRDVTLRWTDDTGAVRTSTVRAARAADVPVGTEVVLRYRPGDPGRVFVTGDETSARLSELAFGIGLVVLVTGAAVAVSAVHLARRRAAERRPATTLPVTYARSRSGLARRSWLLVQEESRAWWVPVHWEPVLETLRPGTRAAVHGRPSRDRVVAVDVDGTPVWQSGRRRLTSPRGEVTREPARAAGTDVPLRRHFRADAGLLAAAPVLGLLWAYVNDGGRTTWLLATALSAAVLFWVPTVLGSDPT